MKIVSVVGARPEFVQVAPLSAVLRERHQEVLVHTGQHYDYLMSQAFFKELGLPAPGHNLAVGSGSHGQQTAEILARLEAVLLHELPDLVIVRGDTNSTLAASLAAAKLHIPVAHVEAGERSFDRRMPEEINRLMADAVADLHLCVSQAAVAQLAVEGMARSAHWVGDVMLDAMLANLPRARARSDVLARLALEPGCYSLVTIHRPSNTDDPATLARIVSVLNAVPHRVVFPVHPRTRQALDRLASAAGVLLASHVQLLEPVAYFDMLILEENAHLIATDSGGVQREAYFLAIPCLTLRQNTEWRETVSTGWNRLVGTDPERVLAAWLDFGPPAERPPIFGDGQAAQRIAGILDGQGASFGAVRGPRDLPETWEGG